MAAIPFRIQQGFKYEGDDWWKWWIWIDAPEEKLNAVDHVVYTLHPTFVNPVRIIDDRRSKFKLQSEGWGVFTIYARIYLKNNTEVAIEHDLHLEYPDGKKNLS